MEFRNASTPVKIASALTIDEAHLGSDLRAGYIATVAAKGRLSVPAWHGEVCAFACLDHGYFFGGPFVSLLVVDPGARRRGLGTGLLAFNSRAHLEVWTSTN